MVDRTIPRRHRSPRRSRAPFVLTALGVCLTTAAVGCAVVWLAVHVLADVPEPAHALVDAAELLKIALASGLSEWAATAQTS